MAKRKCRDCPACTRSLMGRMVVASSGATMVAAMGRTAVKSCPQCGHALMRHERRKDGGFID
jgi:predicted RNA-binding Zn-ribbon protein involved in translation (DUF1610 family)